MPRPFAALLCCAAVFLLAGWLSAETTPGPLPALAAPSIRPASGGYVGSISIRFEGASGHALRYTLDGSDPGAASPLYVGPFTLTASATVRVRAVAADGRMSPIASASYVITPRTLAAPVPRPAPGAHPGPVAVTMSAESTTTVIRYTLDGRVPDETSPVYQAPVPVPATTTLTARAFRSGWNPSAPVGGVYLIGGVSVAPPVADPPPGLFTDRVDLRLTSPAAGAVLHYTLDGSQPTAASAVASGPIALTASTTVRAIAVAGGVASPVAAFAYTLAPQAPTLSPAGGAFSGPVAVAIACASPGAVVRYTLDGSAPTAQSPIAPVPLPLTVSATLSARAFVAGQAPGPVASAVFAIALPVAAAPTVDIAPGSYDHELAVTLAASVPGAQIRYTLDGSVPTVASPVASGPVAVGISTTLAARTFAPGYDPSPLATFVYELTAGAVTISPAGGTHAAPVAVALSTATHGAAIHYRLDGTAPTATDPQADGPLTVETSAILTARALRAGWTPGPVASATFTIATPTAVAAPTVTPAAGAFTDRVDVSFAAAAGAVVHYTVDGSTPTLASPTVAGPLTLTTSATLRAIAVLDGVSSPVAAFAYVIAPQAPTLSPAGGSFTGAVDVAIASGSPGAAIHYTLDGSVPTTGSPLAAGTVRVGASATLSARAFVAGQSPSPVTSASYVITVPVAAVPSVDVAPGSYDRPLAVTLASGTPGAVIRYTLDGSQPGAASLIASGPIVIDASATLAARVSAAGYDPSPVASFAYELVAGPVAIAPGAGTHPAPVAVTLTTATPGAAIHYRLDGGTPTAADPQVLGPVPIASSGTLTARALRPGWTAGPVASAAYTIPALPPGAAPTATPAPGTYPDRVEVLLAAATGAAIHYTLDGSTPTAASPRATGPVVLTASATVRAVAISGGVTSPTAAFAYVLQARAPVLDPPGGTYDDWQQVTATSASPGARLYYTVDGSVPTESSTPFSGPLDLRQSAPIAVRAFVDGQEPSAVTVADYQLLLVAQTPTASMPSGTYSQELFVRLSSRYAEVRYTLDGSIPTQSSPWAALPIEVRTPTVIKARAFRFGFAPSAVATFTYDFTSVLFSVPPATYANAIDVAMTPTIAGAEVRYRLDGAAPTASDPVASGRVRIATTTTIRARCFVAGAPVGAETTVTYVIGVTPAVTPAIAFSAPSPGAVVTSLPTTIAFTVTCGDQLDEVRLDGQLLATAPGTSYAGAVSRTFAEGPRTVVVTATSRAGVTVTERRSFTVDARPPVVAIHTPLAGATVSEAHAHVRARVDTLGGAVVINGITATRSGYMAMAWVPLAAGSNVIAVAASDGGRTGSDSVTITRTIPAGYDPAQDSDLDGVPDGQDLFPNDPVNAIDADADGVGRTTDIDDTDPTVQTHVVISTPVDGTIITTGYP